MFWFFFGRCATYDLFSNLLMRFSLVFLFYFPFEAATPGGNREPLPSQRSSHTSYDTKNEIKPYFVASIYSFIIYLCVK